MGVKTQERVDGKIGGLGLYEGFLKGYTRPPQGNDANEEGVHVSARVPRSASLPVTAACAAPRASTHCQAATATRPPTDLSTMQRGCSETKPRCTLRARHEQARNGTEEISRVVYWAGKRGTNQMT